MLTARHLGTVVNRLWRPLIICCCIVSFCVNGIWLPLTGHPPDSVFMCALLTSIGSFAVIRTVEKRLGLVNRETQVSASDPK